MAPPVLQVVAARAHLEAVVVAGEHERRVHLEVGQRPVPLREVDVVLAVLEEDADRLRVAAGTANQVRVLRTAQVPRVAADVADDLAEGVGALPGDGEGRQSAVAHAGDRPARRVIRQVVVLADLREDLLQQEAGVGVGDRRVLDAPQVPGKLLHPGIDEDADRHRHLAPVDQVVEDGGRSHRAFGIDVELAVLEDHDGRGLGAGVLGRDVDPVVVGRARVDAAGVPGALLDRAGGDAFLRQGVGAQRVLGPADSGRHQEKQQGDRKASDPPAHDCRADAAS